MRSREVSRVLVGVVLAACGGDDSSHAPAVSCDNTQLAFGCSVGHCRVASASAPLPSGTQMTLSEVPVPAELQNPSDALGATLCNVQVPEGTKTSDISLAITLDTAPPDGALLFEHVAAGNDAALAASGKVSSTVSGFITHSAQYGATVKPGAWTFDEYLGASSTPAIDTPTLLRNLATNVTSSAFYDGKHLFVGSGPRLLVFDGIPSPSQKPSVVLGQPDLNTSVAATSAALFGNASPTGLWSDGTKLVAAMSNRVLVWEQIPTASLTPADLVLGQPDFTTNKANVGGVSASSLNSVVAVSSDGTHLAVADALNERVLVWDTFPTASSQPADFVIGQPDFKSNAAYGGNLPIYVPEGVGATSAGLYLTGIAKPGLAFVSWPTASNPPATYSVFRWEPSGDPGGPVARPSGVVVMPGGAVGVRDFGLMRVAFTRAAPSGPSPVDYEIGQPDTTRVDSMRFTDNAYIDGGRVNASTLSLAIGASFGSGVLVAADTHRALVWDAPPSYNYEPASRVIGQPGFTVNEASDYRGVSLSTMAHPSDVAIGGGVVAVADKSNNRVLLFHASDLAANGAAAFAAIGQPDGTSFIANKDIVSPDATTLSGPEGVALDGTHVIVADTENHRVLIWNKVPSASGAAADVVLGQADFSGRRPNHARGDASPVDGFSDVDGDGFFYPTGVASDGTHLFVADKLNHRVLVWDAFPTKNGQMADRVLGQPTMKTVGAHGGAGAFSITSDGFNLPTGVTLAGTTLWVADTANNRVVRWDNATSAAMAAPGAWVGQADGTSVSNPNYQLTGAYRGDDVSPPAPTGATSVLRPRSVVVSGGKLFVSELDSNRVHVLDASTFASLAVLGQSNDTSAALNAQGIAASSLAEPGGLATDGTTLFVADTRNHRMVGYPLSSVATGASATLVAGQATLLTNGFNQSSVAAQGGVSQPRGLALSQSSLFVADTGNNRVFSADVTASTWLPNKVWGQPNDTLALPNAGGAISGHGFSAPRGVYADDKRLIVADTGNHRVLVFDRTAAPPKDAEATIVLGQKDAASGAPNAGGAASASTMQAPANVCSDGTRLAVLDTSNHRVLVYNALPTASGQAADAVLGQADAASIAPNRGTSTASASTMAFPAACAFVGDKLYVADSGNNRVLRFTAGPVVSGAPAEAVLGQPDASTRTPASTATDTTHLAGPAALSSDGANLYVADRDLARVVVLDASGAVKDVIGGIGGSSVLRAGTGVVATKTPLFTSRLYVSDSSADRIGVVSSVGRLIVP